MRESTYTVWIVCVLVSTGVTGAVVLPQAIENYRGIIPYSEYALVLAYFVVIMGTAKIATDKVGGEEVGVDE